LTAILWHNFMEDWSRTLSTRTTIAPHWLSNDSCSFLYYYTM